MTSREPPRAAARGDAQASPAVARVAWMGLAALVLACPLSYCGAYLYARATHRLVNYGSFIAGPHALSGGGFGLNTDELVFAPLVALESAVRGVDPRY